MNVVSVLCFSVWIQRLKVVFLSLSQSYLFKLCRLKWKANEKNTVIDGLWKIKDNWRRRWEGGGGWREEGGLMNNSVYAGTVWCLRSPVCPGACRWWESPAAAVNCGPGAFSLVTTNWEPSCLSSCPGRASADTGSGSPGYKQQHTGNNTGNIVFTSSVYTLHSTF